MDKLVELIAKRLVDHPEDVQVTVVEGEGPRCIELRVHQDDMGRIIGKNGRTVKAIRTVLSSASVKLDTRVNLQIIE